EILLLTFTKKAAGEMLARVESLVGMNLGRIWGGTFHHVGNMVLRRHAALMGLGEEYAILDRDDSRTLVDGLIREAGLDVKAREFPKSSLFLETLGYARNTRTSLETAVSVKCPVFEKAVGEIERLAAVYEKRKRARNYLDFEDLLALFHDLLLAHPEVAAEYQNRFRHVLVDEYQDTNALQAAIVKILAAGHGNVMAVGDDAQSIYSFRGAVFRNIREFPRDFPGCRIFTVETNYRSTPEVLALANQVLRGGEGYAKRLRPARPAGPLPVLVRPLDVYDQARFLAQRIAELIEEGTDPGEIAVLYRAHFHSMEVQMELTRAGIPFSVRSGLRFFAQAHVKDVLAYLRVVDNPMDEVSWKRILTTLPRLGPRTAEKIWARISSAADPAAELASAETARSAPAGARDSWESFVATVADLRSISGQGPRPMIERVLEGDYGDYLKAKYSNSRNREDDLRQLAEYARGNSDLHRFLDELAMSGGTDPADAFSESPRPCSVVLSSVHQAKGLEWEAVFVLWLAEGRFPAASSFGDDEAMEEERRLFYVAATRCRTRLTLLQPLSARQRSGETQAVTPSRFLVDLPHDTYEEWDLYDIDCDVDLF
ncbi:MAG TPA: ATP-dependent helicase, partial [bacterium]|nr:ATP-dependent helicase [bacterium]